MYTEVTILNDDVVRAAKEHTCSLCHHPISKKTMHRVYTFVYDKCVYRRREHQSCCAIMTVAGYADEEETSREEIAAMSEDVVRKILEKFDEEEALHGFRMWWDALEEEVDRAADWQRRYGPGAWQSPLTW